MKIGSAIVLHVAVLGAFTLTGCETTKSQGSGRGAGAKHKAPFRHEHKDKAETASAGFLAGDYPIDDMLPGDDLFTGGEPFKVSGYDVEPQPTTTTATTEVYIVKKGDMLSQLAVDFDTTTATLVELNRLSNPDVLYVGQELRVPAGRGASKTTTKSTGSVQKGGNYTIQKGDTLSGIAIAAGVSINDLRSLNNIKGDKIMAGETLAIPSYGKVPSSARKTSTSSASSTTTKKPVTTTPTKVEPAVQEVGPVLDIAGPTVATPDSPMSLDVIEDKVLYPGETLDDVARQYGVSKAEIMRQNNISNESQVREGMRLRIPIAE
ncbi:LysM peptidoglycan-binding domain-containing protein [Pontiella sp.]|uniref:LysM peptidoglycan-binding domain-containing protein n=1 Tax=Pontiella sp. TaxID=2837462 RepID=UPI003564EAEA